MRHQNRTNKPHPEVFCGLRLVVSGRFLKILKRESHEKTIDTDIAVTHNHDPGER